MGAQMLVMHQRLITTGNERTLPCGCPVGLGEGAHPAPGRALPSRRSPRPPGTAAAGAVPQTGNLSWVLNIYKSLPVGEADAVREKAMSCWARPLLVRGREMLCTHGADPKMTEFAPFWRQHGSFPSCLPGRCFGMWVAVS